MDSRNVSIIYSTKTRSTNSHLKIKSPLPPKGIRKKKQQKAGSPKGEKPVKRKSKGRHMSILGAVAAAGRHIAARRTAEEKKAEEDAANKAEEEKEALEDGGGDPMTKAKSMFGNFRKASVNMLKKGETPNPPAGGSGAPVKR
jgi:hypothetical protein